MEATYPDMAVLLNITTSYEGRQIYALRVIYTKQKKKRYPTSNCNVLWKINLSKKNVA